MTGEFGITLVRCPNPSEAALPAVRIRPVLLASPDHCRRKCGSVPISRVTPEEQRDSRHRAEQPTAEPRYEPLRRSPAIGQAASLCAQDILPLYGGPSPWRRRRVSVCVGSELGLPKLERGKNFIRTSRRCLGLTVLRPFPGRRYASTSVSCGKLIVRELSVNWCRKATTQAKTGRVDMMCFLGFAR